MSVVFSLVFLFLIKLLNHQI